MRYVSENTTWLPENKNENKKTKKTVMDFIFLLFYILSLSFYRVLQINVFKK